MTIAFPSYSQTQTENTEVGRFTSIAAGVSFANIDNHPCIQFPKVVSTYPFAEMLKLDYPISSNKGVIKIGNDVWIGVSVYILNGVTIGDGAIVAAYSVVTKDVPPFALVAGNPAKIKKYRFSKEIREKLLKIQWWNWDVEIVKERIKDFHNIDEFVDKYYDYTNT